MFDYVLEWESLKEALSASLRVSHALLHVHLGLAAYVLVGALLRNPLGSPIALIAVVVLELANEAADFVRYNVSNWPWTPENTAEDILNTLFWPTILYFCAWWHQRRQRRLHEVIEVDPGA